MGLICGNIQMANIWMYLVIFHGIERCHQDPFGMIPQQLDGLQGKILLKWMMNRGTPISGNFQMVELCLKMGVWNHRESDDQPMNLGKLGHPIFRQIHQI